jgi:hypothetical protein
MNTIELYLQGLTDKPKSPRSFIECYLQGVAFDEWEEEKHPRDRDGKFGKGEGCALENKQMTPEEKINSLKIDFSKDNILPELNSEDLEELGVESKPVLLKKNIIIRNLSRHPEVKPEDYEFMLGEALYNSDAIFRGNEEKPYFNFISRVNDEKNSIVLLEVSETKHNYEIVHLHWAKDKQRRTLERKGERKK